MKALLATLALGLVAVGAYLFYQQRQEEAAASAQKPEASATSTVSKSAEGKTGAATNDAFFTAKSSDTTALPADGFYPQGQKLVYAGYSGKPERDLAEGFTVGGPFYGSGNKTQSLAAIKAGRPFLVQIGIHGANNTRGIEASAKLSDVEVRRLVAEEVKLYLDAETAAQKTSVVWWCVEPEELRPWKPAEMRYLKLVSEAIREADPHHRPVFLYNPNHRDAKSLAPIAAQVDILAKGAYTNSAGFKEARGWIRYGIEQLVTAAETAKRPKAVVLMPELCKDPAPADLNKIEAWVRHDTYLGLMSGAKGVVIWSLFPRKEVKATWQRWYDAYATVGRELNAPGGLAPVFLFGERRTDLVVTPLVARPNLSIAGVKRSAMEENTSSAAESQTGELPSWTAKEIVYDKSHYIFLANSRGESTPFRVEGLPSAARLVKLPSGEAVPHTAGKPLELTLAPWEVVILKASL